ncbi:FMN-binding negative transcriptional regulator [Stenotrophomonas mori]|uniref:FMN-binding negative transcriptional regulator n=1 Tax=Stenotrophomonas mori TaxID=2871096 RepID=A0ABT0SHM9_9GAMM|nr:FMN-binding negative transcriptional regulator [Stenotrophomonas mori]MCL7714837.1 FMN-binding negative transcriptional regulator [Stenotrophomonas mori]
MGHAYDESYAARNQADLVALIEGNPLAWVVSGKAEALMHSPLPLRCGYAADGRLSHLLGHLALRNPLAARLREDPMAAAFFLGPQAYVSASWLDDRTQAPTWNYCAAAFQLKVELHDAPGAIRDELSALVAQMEAGRPKAWQLEEMEGRYAHLARHVVAFRAQIVSVHSTFKLGQDERPGDYAQIAEGLGRSQEASLLHWMRRFEARDEEP